MMAVIYEHPWVYRFIMTVLYGGRYKARYFEVLDLVPMETKTVTELCFGDAVIARELVSRNIAWIGIEASQVWVDRARSHGLDARLGDAGNIDELEPSDVLVCQGSLYHFKPYADDLLENWCQLAHRVIVSEPTRNLSSQDGLLGRFARRITSTGGDRGTERFSEQEFRDLCAAVASRVGMDIDVREAGKDTIAIFDRSA